MSFTNKCLTSLITDVHRMNNNPTPTSIDFRQHTPDILINGVNITPDGVNVTHDDPWTYEFTDPVNATNEIVSLTLRITQNNDEMSSTESVNIGVYIGNGEIDDPYTEFTTFLVNYSKTFTRTVNSPPTNYLYGGSNILTITVDGHHARIIKVEIDFKYRNKFAGLTTPNNLNMDISGDDGLHITSNAGKSQITLTTNNIITELDTAIKIPTDSEHGLTIKEGENDYLIFNTMESAEKIISMKPLIITDNTTSSSTTTGALKITGGVGIGDNLFVGGDVNISGSLTYGGSSLNSFSLTDNLTNSFSFKQGDNNYMTFDTTNSAEKIKIHKNIDISGQETVLSIYNNSYSSFSIKNDTDGYLTFITALGGEKIYVNKPMYINAPVLDMSSQAININVCNAETSALTIGRGDTNFFDISTNNYSMTIDNIYDLYFKTETIHIENQNTSLFIRDNSATAFAISQSGNNYITFDTTNLAEKIKIHKNLDFDGSSIDISSQITDVLLKDNTNVALDFKEGSNSYMNFNTTNDSESIVLNKKTIINDSLVNNSYNIHLGTYAGANDQGEFSIAIGGSAARDSQSSYGISIGTFAGQTNQGQYGITIGYYCGNDNQSNYGIACGYQAGYGYQGVNGIAIGNVAGSGHQGENGIAIGNNAGLDHQEANSIAIGSFAAQITQGVASIAVGNYAGSLEQGSNSVATGYYAGYSHQGSNSVAIGYSAGNNTQGTEAISIGTNAGNLIQANHSVAVGNNSGREYQGADCVAIGNNSAIYSQGTNSVSVGNEAGYNGQGAYAIAIGSIAGRDLQGDYSIAVGRLAGHNEQAANSIILNSTGSALDATTSGCFIKPLGSNNSNSFLPAVYNPTTGELSYCSPSYNGSTDATGTVTLDMDTNSYFHITYTTGGSIAVTLANPSNMVVGQRGQIILVTNGTNNTITFGDYWKFTGGISPTLSTTDTIDVINYYIFSSTQILCSYLSNMG